MSISLNQIDELKRRANISYGEAKEALEKNNGDLLEAIIYLEQQNKVNPEQDSSLLNKMKKLLNKANNTRFIIRKKNQTVLDLSVTVTVIITAFASYVVIPGLMVALVTGHKINLAGKNGEDMKVNETIQKITDAVEAAKKKLAEDDLNTATR